MTSNLPPADGDTVDRLLLRHLETAALPETANDLVLAALLGEDDLQAVLGGAATSRPQPHPTDVSHTKPIGAYLTSIEVTGFRGIGPTATLDLVPGPGLTIVTGRNGSGKSSFAEAAELALTGDNKRWAGRSAVWQDGWRNLHAAEGSSIRVRLGVEGHRNGATVECHWDAGADFAHRAAFLQLAGQRRRSIAELGWDEGLELYRPFLSYSELGGLLSGRPSAIHDLLQAVLGLERLVEIEAMLKAARREANDRRKRAGERLPALRAMLEDHHDARASQAEKVLAGKVVDLDRLEGLATTDEPADDTASLPLRQLAILQLPSREDLVDQVGRLHHALRQISELAGTPAEEARALAGLLDDALRHHRGHPDQPCPVCGGALWTRRGPKARRLNGSASFSGPNNWKVPIGRSGRRAVHFVTAYLLCQRR